MKRAIFIGLLIFVYSFIYKFYIFFQGETAIYIINPLVWILISYICHTFLHTHNTKANKNDFVKYVVTILSLLYIISYYALGIVTGYKNNPYSTTISGIIINSFSVLFVVCMKEYTRYKLIKVNIKKYHKLYLSIVYVIFTISDINLQSILESTDFLTLWSKELFTPIMINLLMMYLSYVSDYRGPIISRTILLVPSLIFNVLPDNDWPIIIIFNMVYCIVLYILVRRFVIREEKVPEAFSGKSRRITKILIGITLVAIVIAFGVGFFSVKPIVILSGSMEPYISPGDMVIIQKTNASDVNVGDIIEYKLPNFNVVHRVISITYNNGDRFFITKGDANQNPDKAPVSSNQIIGKYIFNIPFVGYPTYLIKNIVDNNEEIDIEQGGANNE